MNLTLNLIFNPFKNSIGDNIKLLLEREDQKYTFSLINNRIYYLPEKLRVVASHLPIKELVSFGTCFGKITKSNKFKLHITALDFLAPYAKVKITANICFDLFTKLRFLFLV